MICAQCQSEGKMSRVYPGNSFVKAVYIQPYYDESGNYHTGSPPTETKYKCSNGHEWKVSS